MKTITEAANDYSCRKDNEYESYVGFKDGVSFAQRWIPIEEELPTLKNHGFSDRVLTKDRLDNFKIERYDYEFNHFNDIRYDSIVDGDGQVTHWRPIEFK